VWEKILETIYSIFLPWNCLPFVHVVFEDVLCALLLFVLCVFLYCLVCIVVILCVFVVLCVYCLFYL